MQHFISDLHLNPTQPETAKAFVAYLQGPAKQAQTLWILGDLFEYWTGDEDIAHPFHTEMVAAIAALSATGTQVRVVVGNRDFLMGQAFAKAAGAELVAEPISIDLYGKRAVLLHGDILCTDDVAYQQFRAMVRNPAWQTQFLAQPVAVRHKLAAELRAKSEMGKQEKSSEIMDVNAAAVEAYFKTHNASLMIHGHTHRPATHQVNVDGQSCERWVLSDWHGKATWLEASEQGLQARTL